MPVRLLADAGLYREGAEFYTLDWASSAHAERWPNGSRWLWEGPDGEHVVKVIGGRPVRDDGKRLYTQAARYEWR